MESPTIPTTSETQVEWGDKNLSNDEEREKVEREVNEEAVIAPLDGGYGWIIVLSSFLLNMAVDGVIFTTGKIVIPAWVEAFKIPTASSSLTVSILSAFYFFVGPVSSALCNVFGCRAVAFAGSIIAIFGFLISALCSNIYSLYLTFGIVSGTGFGMMYLPSIVIISQYFSKKRSLATGIAVCGSGIGTTIFAMVNELAFSYVEGDWHKYMIYTAIIAAIGIPSSLLLKPLRISSSRIQRVASIINHYEHPEQDESKEEVRTRLLENAETDVEQINKPLSKDDVFYVGSAQALAIRSRSNTLDENAVRLIKKEKSIHATQSRKIEHVAKKSVKEELLTAVRNIIDRELLASPSFLVLAFSGTLTVCCFYVPFIYLGNHLEKINGLSKTEIALPISLIGIINIIARIICGYISDHPKVSALHVSNTAITIAGLSIMVVPFFTQYWHFIAFCVPFSFGVACFATLRSVITVELVGVVKLTNAFGLLLPFMSVGAALGSPMAAAIKDLTGNYDISFYLMGLLMTISGLMCYPLMSIRNWEMARSQNKTENESSVQMSNIQETI